MNKRSFDEMTKAEAEAFFAAYVAAGPQRIDWLRQRTGLDLEPGREALVDVWRWFLEWAAAGGTEEPADGLPMWAAPSWPEQGEPLRWDDPRPRSGADPHPPGHSPPTQWVTDAMSYFFAECLRLVDGRLGYRLEREDERMVLFNQPVLEAAGTKMPGLGMPLIASQVEWALAPRNDWEAEAREPDALALFHDQVLERAARAKPGKKVRPPKTALELLARRGVDALFAVGTGADGEIVVDVDEVLAVVGSDAVDCVAARLEGAARTDREVITVIGGGDAAVVEASVRRHLLDCITGGSPDPA